MSNEYKPHTLEWTDEKVARFWNFRNNYAPYDDTWFTLQAGPAVLALAHQQVPLKGAILDYGTGKGYLLKYLLDGYPSADIYACDFTDSLVTDASDRFGSYPKFKGAQLLTDLPSAYASDSFDVVFLIETIEHLTDNYLHATFKEIHRILKPGGTVVITTPNDEALEKTFVHCADCGATFHHMQHIRNWNEQSIDTLARQFGFSKVFCKGVNIQWYNQKGFLYRLMDQLKGLVRKNKYANLVYIGKK